MSANISAKGSGRGITELYTHPTLRQDMEWAEVVKEQHCRYIGKRCAKRRKTEPDVSIGTCTVGYNAKNPKNIIICPFRFLERRQVFTHCLHLLTHTEPGDEHHVVSEVTIPGGSVDYCLVATRKGRVVDFVASNSRPWTRRGQSGRHGSSFCLRWAWRTRRRKTEAMA